MGAVYPALHMHCQTLPRVFINQVQHAHCPSIVSEGADEVVRPDVILMLGPQPHARAVIEPQASTRFLLLWNLQPFAAPDPFHSILAHNPAGLMQLDRDAPITIPTKLAGQRDDGPG